MGIAHTMRHPHGEPNATVLRWCPHGGGGRDLPSVPFPAGCRDKGEIANLGCQPPPVVPDARSAIGSGGGPKTVRPGMRGTGPDRPVTNLPTPATPARTTADRTNPGAGVRLLSRRDTPHQLPSTGRCLVSDAHSSARRSSPPRTRPQRADNRGPGPTCDRTSSGWGQKAPASEFVLRTGVFSSLTGGLPQWTHEPIKTIPSPDRVDPRLLESVYIQASLSACGATRGAARWLAGRVRRGTFPGVRPRPRR
jgi:hypothetical protein